MFCFGRAGGHCHVCSVVPVTLGEIPADKTCTSLPQTWSAPRGHRLEPEPVMKCTFAQAFTDQVGKHKRPPIKVLDLCSKLAKEHKPPPFSYLLSDQETSGY